MAQEVRCQETREPGHLAPAGPRSFVALRLLDPKEAKGALDEPEHCEATYAISGDEFRPAWEPSKEAAGEENQRQHQADEEEVPGLDAKAEEQERGWNVGRGQPGIA